MTDGTRIRLTRRAGFRLQQQSHDLNGLPAVIVSRPSAYGNPYGIVPVPGGYEVQDRDGRVCGTHGLQEEAHTQSVELFRDNRPWESVDPNLTPLRNVNLACWCREGLACHADVLLVEVARLERRYQAIPCP